jgi:hypothetical protein
MSHGRMNRRYIISGSLLAGGHLGLSIVLFAMLFSAGMDRFDHGGEPAGWEPPAEILLGILQFPLVLIAHSRVTIPDIIESVTVLTTSLCWGFGLAWVIFRIRGRVLTGSASITTFE